MAELAPIVVFAYRRPEHLRQTLQNLMACEEFKRSPVIVYGDAPGTLEHAAGTEAARRVARDMLGTGAEYHFSDINQGLSKSIINGVTAITNRFGKAIVIEDDIRVAPTFLKYMNSALDRYAVDNSVFQISGYMVDVPELAIRRNALFLPLTVSWGWATWKRAWDRFDPTATGWQSLLVDGALQRKFDLDGVYGYSTMLVRQMLGLRDSWAIRWYWTSFVNEALTLFPPRSLVLNMGFDGSGTHGRGVLRTFSSPRTEWPNGAFELPERIVVNEYDFALLKEGLQRTNGGWLGVAVDRLRWRATKMEVKLRGIP